jgi:hypothetical protein
VGISGLLLRMKKDAALEKRSFALLITEKEELKPGLVLFRRGDVEHRMWYCRMKMPKADRYKTVSLKTTDISAAREGPALAGPCQCVS